MSVADKKIFIGFVALAICSLAGSNVEAAECLECEGEQCLRTSYQNNSVTCSGGCVAVFDQFSLQKRGCLSSLSTADQNLCALASNKTCYTCDTELCNKWGREDHTCLVCSSATDLKCLNEAKTVNATRCPASQYSDALCFTKLSANSTSRGCLTTNREAIACANDQEHCTWCNVDETGACNRAAFPVGRRQCLHCDSTVDKNCPTNTTSTDTKSIYCDNVADLCIIINKGPKSTQSLLQTCSEKISNSDVEFCRANKSSCIACTENNCNWPKPCDPSSSNQINVMHSATVVAIVAFGFLMS